MSNWYILKTEPQKEVDVEFALKWRGFITYLPMEHHVKKISRRANIVIPKPKPAIPRVVFFFASEAAFPLPDIDNSAGLARGSDGPWCVSDRQMRYFQEGIAAAYCDDGSWLPISKEEKKAHKAREKAKRTANSLVDLIKFTPELFGTVIDEYENAA